MDLINFLFYSAYYFAVALSPFVVYFLFFRDNNGRSAYSNRDIFYAVKYIFSKRAIESYRKKWQRKDKQLQTQSERIVDFESNKHSHWQQIDGIDPDGNTLNLKLILRPNKIAEAYLFLRLANGSVYKFPEADGVRVAAISEEQNWKINGLSIEVLEPLKRLRILFNGILENISSHGSRKYEHVRFNFIFNACRSPKFFPEDVDTSILADAVASKKWEDGTWTENMSEQFGYDQFGSLRGYIKGDAYEDDLLLNLATTRSRYDGVDDRFALWRQVRIFIADSERVLIHLVLKSFKNGVSQLNYGSIYRCNRKIWSIDSADIRLQNLAPHKTIPDIFVVHIQAKQRTYKAVLHLKTTKVLKASNNEEKGYEIFEVPAEVDLDNNQARANVEFWYRRKGDIKSSPRQVILYPKKAEVLPNSFVTKIQDEESKIVALTGGKGSSLALLCSLESNKFSVPLGFILTVNSYNHQINSYRILKDSIEKLDAICCGRIEGSLEEACKETVELFKKTPVSLAVQKEIFGMKHCEENKDKSSFAGWAVRSSAVGEDSEDLSAAGQNETFLGLTGSEEILQAVAACWASLYSYQSVQYRWQHGLPVPSEIAVVVQKMVPADCAGVLFTCHPTTLNPSQMVITANYGLGESVVSGQSEPDTIILNKTIEGTISILEEIVGNKQDVVKLTESGVTTIQSSTNKDQLSITKNQAIQLGEVGALIEDSFGGARDIEWAFCNDKLFLLQSRPVTTLNSWTEYELTHEFDTPIVFTSDVYTRANVGEVMPKPMSSLGLCSGVSSSEKALQVLAQRDYDPLVCKGLNHSYFYIFLDVAGSIHSGSKKEIDVNSRVLDLAIFGHPILNEKIHKAALERNDGGVTLFRILSDVIRMGSNLFKLERLKKEALEEGRKFRVDIRDEDSLQQIHDNIKKGIEDTDKIGFVHCLTSGTSIFSEFLTINVLLEGRKEFSTDLFADIALILSSCEDVVSADVPAALENMAEIIRKVGLHEEFCKLKPEEGVKFLEENCLEAFKLFEEFLNKHGHRTICEFDVFEESWEMNPSKVIDMLQANVKHGKTISKVQKTVEEVVSNLTTPQKSITRRIIKFLLVQVRKAVGIRETSKSELIRTVNVLRKAIRKLAKRMVLEGFLPSENLIFHLSLYELGEVIKTRNPLLIIKAKKRQQLHEKLTKLVFPEIIYGVPEPEKEEQIQEVLTSVLKGTPVCTGEVKARACVVTSLEEIHQLLAGDILITRSTDIGWSPYFPMVSGVVTELGGLVSHGAVVAREYGLPCVVGVKNVTKVFKTGDQIYLNAKTGELGKT